MPHEITSVTCHPQGWIDLGTAVSVTCILYVGNVFVHASVNTAIYTGVCLYSSDLTCLFYDHELSCMLFRPAVIDFAMCSLWSVMCKRLKWKKISVLYLGVVCSHMQSDCATVIVNVSTTRAFSLHNTFAVAWSLSSSVTSQCYSTQLNRLSWLLTPILPSTCSSKNLANSRNKRISVWNCAPNSELGQCFFVIAYLP